MGACDLISQCKIFKMAVAILIPAFLLLTGATRSSGAGPILPLNERDKRELAILGDGVVGPPIEAPVISDPSEYYRPMVGQWRYQITSGEQQGQDFTETLSRIPRNAQGATWKRSRDKYEDLVSVSDESIHLTNEIDHQHGYLVDFKPMGHLLTASLKPGESRTIKSTVHTYTLSDPSTVYKTLKMKETYTYVGAYRVTTPAGVFDSVLFRNDFKVFAGPVTVDDFRYAFYAKGVGKVAGIEHGHAVVLLVFRFNQKIPKVLVNYPKSGN